MFKFLCYNCYGNYAEVCKVHVNCLRRKTHMQVWRYKHKVFLVLPLGLTCVFQMSCFPDHGALNMSVTHRSTLLSEQGCWTDPIVWFALRFHHQCIMFKIIRWVYICMYPYRPWECWVPTYRKVYFDYVLTPSVTGVAITALLLYTREYV